MHSRCFTRSYWALRRRLTDTRVEHRCLAPSPPWAGRDGEGRSGGPRVAKGAKRAQLCPLRRPPVRGALIAFMAATPQAQAEATKARCAGLSELRC
jgi:hypothetical protein